MSSMARWAASSEANAEASLLTAAPSGPLNRSDLAYANWSRKPSTSSAWHGGLMFSSPALWLAGLLVQPAGKSPAPMSAAFTATTPRDATTVGSTGAAVEFGFAALLPPHALASNIATLAITRKG